MSKKIPNKQLEQLKYNKNPDIENLNCILNLDNDINQKIFGTTLLTAAIKRNFYDTIVFLLEKGIDINADDNNGLVPLMYAIKYDKYDNSNNNISKLLIDKGANVNLSDYYEGNTALMYATITCERHDYKNNDGKIDVLFNIIKLLLKNGAKLNKSNNKKYTALMLMLAINIDHRRKIEIVNLFLEKGADINKVNHFGETALTIAIKKPFNEENNSIVKILLYKRPNVYINNKYEGKNFFSYIKFKEQHEFLRIIETMKCAELCMKKVFRAIKIYHNKFFLRPTSFRTILLNIKWDMVTESYITLVEKYKWMFRYFGIYDDDTMKSKIMGNVKLMDRINYKLPN